jgi:hypothetical protein
MFELCAPALIYVAFSVTQIIIDTFKGLYNTAFFKFIVMIIITILLNALCQAGMSVVSWVIVFVPFIFMSVIVAILLYVFGLDAATGTLDFKCDGQDSNSNKGGNLIYTTTNTKPKPKPNPKPYIDTSYSDTPTDNTNDDKMPPISSSDPEYE